MTHVKNTIFENIKSLLIILPLAFFIRTFIYGLYQVPTGSMEKTMLVGERFLADKFTVWFGKLDRNDIIAFNDYWMFEYSNNPAMRMFQMYVWGPQNWTKRIIGKPGDHVQGKIEDGKPVVYLNGQKLDEPYINTYPLIATLTPGSLPTDQNGYAYRTYDPAKPFDEQPFYHMNFNNIAIAKRVYAAMGLPQLLEPGTPATDGKRLVDEFDVHLGDNQYWVMGDNRQNSGDSRYNGPLPGEYIHAKIVFRLWSLDSDESWWIVDLIKHPVDFWRRVRWSRFFQWL